MNSEAPTSRKLVKPDSSVRYSLRTYAEPPGTPFS